MNIVFIGSGNVATALAKGFYAAGHTINQVYSQTEVNAHELAQQVESSHTNILSKLITTADIYIIAIKDAHINEVVGNMPIVNGLVMHTSGATDMAVLNKFDQHGVLYAPQSFIKNIDIDLEETAFCIEANTSRAFEVVEMLVFSISSHLHVINTQQRLALHVAAVFANNFTQHMLTQAQQLLQQEHIPIALLKPIIEETFRRLDFTDNTNWQTLQTGPAVRGDEITMQKHLVYLHTTKPSLEELYKVLSNAIQKGEF